MARASVLVVLVVLVLVPVAVVVLLPHRPCATPNLRKVMRRPMTRAAMFSFLE